MQLRTPARFLASKVVRRVRARAVIVCALNPKTVRPVTLLRNRKTAPADIRLPNRPHNFGSFLLTLPPLEAPSVGKMEVVKVKRYLLGAVALVVGAGLAWGAMTRVENQGTELVEVVLPETLSGEASQGKVAFEAKCASCHGINAAGQDGVAPPLVHIIYEPSHHGDDSFHRAAQQGVRAHHWPFGDMPPVKGLTTGDVTMIVRYIRELQQANGIQ